MKHLLVVVLALLPGTALAAPPAGIDAYVARAMKTFGVPGLSLAIVENGKTVLAKGYGVKKIGTDEKVDAHTAFPIGSESKAFTSAALAILVDRGKLKWSDLVKDRLPDFRMYDPYVTDHMTVRDLLTHRSGLSLGEGDLMIFPSTDRSRAEIVHALRYLKPGTGFRESYAYDNILYIVAGALVEAVSGQSWENFVTQNILMPVGMSDAHTNYNAAFANEVALHTREGGPVDGVGKETVLSRGTAQVLAPAGGINASAAGMGRWMTVQLARGKLPDGTRLFSQAQADAMWQPVVVVPPEGPHRLPVFKPDMQDYALGWFVEEYRGHKLIRHTGAVGGALASLYLIPDKDVGIAVAINSDDGMGMISVVYRLVDYYLGLPATDWTPYLDRANRQMIAGAETKLRALPQPEARNGTPPSLALSAYAGQYRDPWYGTITVSERGNGKLWIRFDRSPGMEGPLEPVTGDKFRTRWTDGSIDDAYVNFAIRDGKVAGVAMAAISPLADFSFDYQDLHFVPAH